MSYSEIFLKYTYFIACLIKLLLICVLFTHAHEGKIQYNAGKKDLFCYDCYYSAINSAYNKELATKCLDPHHHDDVPITNCKIKMAAKYDNKELPSNSTVYCMSTYITYQGAKSSLTGVYRGCGLHTANESNLCDWFGDQLQADGTTRVEKCSLCTSDLCNSKPVKQANFRNSISATEFYSTEENSGERKDREIFLSQGTDLSCYSFDPTNNNGNNEHSNSSETNVSNYVNCNEKYPDKPANTLMCYSVNITYYGNQAHLSGVYGGCQVKDESMVEFCDWYKEQKIDYHVSLLMSCFACNTTRCNNVPLSAGNGDENSAVGIVPLCGHIFIFFVTWLIMNY